MSNASAINPKSLRNAGNEAEEAALNASSDDDILTLCGDAESEDFYESVAQLLIDLVFERNVEQQENG